MNPLTNMKNIKKLSEQELQRNFKTSWHDQYKDSAWVFVGGLPYDLTEGDVICVFSQYGEIVNINLVRDKDTGKQKGFCFICYEDQRSTVLAVDNLNGIKILSRSIRVDHVSDYKVPKDYKNLDAETRKLYDEGCAPAVQNEKKPEMPIPSTELPAFAKEEEAPPDGFRLPPRLPIGPVKQEENAPVKKKKEKKHKKEKKSKKKKSKKHKKKHNSDDSGSDIDKEIEADNNMNEEQKQNIEIRHDLKRTKKQDSDNDEKEVKRHKSSEKSLEDISDNKSISTDEKSSKDSKRNSDDRKREFRKRERYDEGKYSYNRRDKRYEEKYEQNYRRYGSEFRYRRYMNYRNDERRRSNERREKERYRR